MFSTISRRCILRAQASGGLNITQLYYVIRTTNIFYFKGIAQRNSCIRQLTSNTKGNKENIPQKFSLAEYRHVYPEFVPDPTVEFRNPIREKLERLDMLSRRAQIDIPEFYVGELKIKRFKFTFIPVLSRLCVFF